MEQSDWSILAIGPLTQLSRVTSRSYYTMVFYTRFFESEIGHQLVREPQAATIGSFVNSPTQPILNKKKCHEAVKT